MNTAAAATIMPSPSSVASRAFYCGQQQQLFYLPVRVSLLLPARRSCIACPPPSPLPAVEAKTATGRENRIARHQRIRKKVEGTPERPRMAVFRSNKHIYVQVIDDTKMHTLASASTMQKPVSEGFEYSSGPTIEVAKKVGEVIAKTCLEKGITRVAFDRGGYPYHGRIEALANAAREVGLQF